jgi:hypothetical protein
VRGRQFLSRSSVLSNLLDDNVSELSENDTLFVVRVILTVILFLIAHDCKFCEPMQVAQSDSCGSTTAVTGTVEGMGELL